MILTLDPSLNAFGWAVLDTSNTIIKCGCIKYPDAKKVSKKDMKDKMTEVYLQDFKIVGSIVKQLDSIIKDQKITTIYTEIPIGYQSARATEALSMAKAVVISITSLNNCMITAVDPFKIKKKITSDKNATKELIYDEMIKLFPSFLNFFPGMMTKVQKYAISDALSVYAATLP